MEILHGQAPERVWHYFEEISAIPRGSGNEAGIADYLEAFARAHGLESYRDALHNVMIYKPASAGCEAAAPLMLQGTRRSRMTFCATRSACRWWTAGSRRTARRLARTTASP